MQIVLKASRAPAQTRLRRGDASCFAYHLFSARPSGLWEIDRAQNLDKLRRHQASQLSALLEQPAIIFTRRCQNNYGKHHSSIIASRWLIAAPEAPKAATASSTSCSRKETPAVQARKRKQHHRSGRSRDQGSILTLLRAPRRLPRSERRRDPHILHPPRPHCPRHPCLLCSRAPRAHRHRRSRRKRLRDLPTLPRDRGSQAAGSERGHHA